MKPRNKFQSAVLAQSALLPPITQAQKKWAFKNCIDHFAYRLPKGRTTCMDCGHSWVMDTPATNCTCPRCRARLQVYETLQRKLTQKKYFNMLTTCGEYQVLRMFLLHCAMEKGCKARTYLFEIGGYWWDNNGKQCIIAVQRVLGRYIDSFTFCSPMAVRNDNEAYQYVASSYLYPRQRLIPNLKRNGFNHKCKSFSPVPLITALLTDNKAEILVKSEQYHLLNVYLKRRFDLVPYWKSIKICIRNNYIISDGALWKDYIDMLDRLGKDLCNAKYVCPEDLRKAHDNIAKKINKIETAQRLKKEYEQIASLEADYLKEKSIFFGLKFSEENLLIKVLESVEEFLTEGTQMHHCVYASQYYKKSDSLILSASIGGKPIETVEVSLSKLAVVQSRGLCNSNTEYHQQIIGLVNKNMNKIRARMTA